MAENERVTGLRRFALYPLQGDIAKDFLLQIDSDRLGQIFIHNGRMYKRTHEQPQLILRGVPIHKETVSENLSLRDAVKSAGELGWPKVRAVSEMARSANLGLVAVFLRLKHTCVNFELENGKPIILDKTADCGSWFRFPGNFEFLSPTCLPVKFEPPRKLQLIWEKMAALANVSGPMAIDYTCQHFSRDCMQAISVEPRPLHNQRVFDVIKKYFPKETDPGRQEELLRYFKSTGLSQALHEQVTSWREVFRLVEIE